MKRIREDSTLQNHAKQTRTDARSSPGVDRFVDALEVQPSVLASEPFDEAGYILGHVFMLWPMYNKTRKLQLRTESGALDVVFEGPGMEKLDFVPKDKVKIALKGGRIEAKRAGSPHTLPFRLVFREGAVIYFLASEKREGDKLLDLFKDADEAAQRAEDDWYHPPPQADPTSEAQENIQEDNTRSSERNSPVIVPYAAPHNSDFAHEIDASSHEDIRPPIQDESPSVQVDPEDDGPELQYVHFIGTSRTEIRRAPLTNTSTSYISNQTINAVPHVHRPSGPPAAQPPPSAQAQRKPEKRVKKRDTRHVRNSIGGAASDTSQIVAQDHGHPDAQKKLGKRTLEKRKAKLVKAGVGQASIGPPPRPRDLALDLVAGFYSEEGGAYTPIGKVTAGRQGYSLVGVVRKVGQAKVSSSGDDTRSFTLVDPSQGEHQCLTVNIFASQTSLLPSATLGQVLLLRNIKVKEFQGKLQGTGYKDSFQWCGYNATTGKHFYSMDEPSTETVFYKPGVAEFEYFVKIADWWRAVEEADRDRISLGDTSAESILTLIPDKLKTIAEMKHETYADCVVELLEIWSHDRNSDIHVTDYSENKYLNHRRVTDGGISGKRTLKITLWDGDNTMVPDLEVHGLYLLKNVRLLKKDARQHLQGSMGFQDRGIFKLTKTSSQANLKELLIRKEEYEDNPSFSRLEPDYDIPEPTEPPHEVQKIEQPAVENRLTPSKSSPPAICPTSVVKCLHLDQIRTTLEEVHRNSMCPNRYHIRARIVDYYPRRIDKFVIVECKSCNKILGDIHRLCPDCGDLSEESTAVRYQFALRVIDESLGELNVGVSNEDANEFLVGLNARYARDDVAALKVRLSPLLGHLEKWHEDFKVESKEPGPWVDMCVNSWIPEASEGVETSRMYTLFGCQLGE